MTEFGAAPDASPAQWLLDAPVTWGDLVRQGTPHLPVHLRIALLDGTDRAGEHPALRDALRVLAGHTATPTHAYAAIWEGWGGDPTPAAPRLAIPHREMLLFQGDVLVLRDAAALGWYGETHGCLVEPHLVWPQDQAWCVACDVDEDIEFSVGCTEPAARALEQALPGAVRRVAYGDPGPLYRD